MENNSGVEGQSQKQLETSDIGGIHIDMATRPVLRRVGIGTTIFSGFVIAAHFLRAGQYALVLLAIASPLLLLTRRRAATIAVQTILALSAIEWLRALYNIAEQRFTRGEPWHRMAVILGGVILITIGSAFLIHEP